VRDARAAKNERNFAAAEDAYNAALDRAIAREARRISSVAVEAATFLVQQREADKAEVLLKRALVAEDASHTPATNEIPVLLQLDGIYSAGKDRQADLASMRGRLVKAWEDAAGRESVVVANNLYRLAGALEQTRQFAEAEAAIQRSIGILEKTYGRDAAPVGFALGSLASIESNLNQDDLAKAALERQGAIRGKPAVQNAARVGGGVSAPGVLSKQEPAYSDAALKKRIQGTVIISLVVDPSGMPADIAAQLPLGVGLDERAVEAVRTWRFQPGKKDGQPINIQAQIEVNFRLL